MTNPDHATPQTVLDRPLVHFGREICGDLDAGLRREWLVTNGLGGYASGTVAGINTRRYHGLLVAALAPPVGRTVLVAGSVDWATYAGRRYPLSAWEYAGGWIEPRGYLHLQAFALEGTIPVWTFALADALLERRVWMVHGANTTYIAYRLRRGGASLAIELRPLVTDRDFHSLATPPQPEIEPSARGVTVHAGEGAVPYRLLADAGEFAPAPDWYWNVFHREEAARGLDDRTNLFTPGTFTATLRPGEEVALILTAEADVPAAADALAAECGRQRGLLRRAGAERAAPAVQQLTLAADQFIVAALTPPTPLSRCAGEGGASTSPPSPVERARGVGGARVERTTIIAGYHWFNDWGRDTMIALPGLTLATGRAADAAAMLRGFAPFVRHGLLPNNFPDWTGVDPGYNTADASLWYVLAVRAFHAATEDDALVAQLLPTLRDILDHHIHGTDYGIEMDPADALLHAGQPGLQLTWMDAKVGDWVVTPRIGKPVEINALWYNALRTVAGSLGGRDDAAARRYDDLAERARISFRQRFVASDQASLADVVDGPDGDDWRVRPNQLFAVSLPFPLLEGEAARGVVEVVGRLLLTSFGPRSLSPDDPAYQGDYGGDARRRDGAYHQGPVWPWLLGAYADAYVRVTGDRTGVRALLEPFADHLNDAGLGSISEIFAGNPPHLPRGCIAQTWSVAEVLSLWRLLGGVAG